MMRRGMGKIGTGSEKALLTVPEVAGLLRLNTKTVYDWAIQGRIPSVKIGRKRLFVRDDIDRWLEARREG